jgi:Bax protein
MIKNIKLNKVNMLIFALCFLVAMYLLIADNNSGLLPLETKPQQRMKILPDFSKILDVQEKKETFFTTLYPIIQEENKHVLKLRDNISTLKSVPLESLTEKQKTWLLKVSTYYKLDIEVIDKSAFNKLLKRVDYVPPSLALTQAAIESGWGTSRFSKLGNNIFGQWCFSKGCGIVPSSRDAGKGHEVSTFATVNKSVRSYIRNLNTHPSYTELRTKRALLREKNEPFTGVALAKTLTKYSEEGAHYVEKVSKFINQNKLQRFTKEFERSLVVTAD